MARLPRRAALALLAAAGCGGGGASGDGGGGDGDGGGGAPPAFPVGEHQWSWIPVDGSRCMDGSATGIGVDLDFSSDRLLILFEGGGACFDDASCGSAAHQDGFGEGQLASFAARAGERGIFDRADRANPATAWSFVLVPYCSGDAHAGATEDGVGGRVQVGFENAGRAATAVAAAMDGRLSRVLLAGQSAGGFGALYNHDQVQRIFGAVPVDLLDDSGPAPPDAIFRPCLQEIFRESWNMAATAPADCAACSGPDGGGLVNLVPFLADKYAGRRFGLVTSLSDRTNRQVFGSGYPDCENPAGLVPADPFAAGMAELRDVVMAPLANAAAYTIDSDEHVWTARPLGDTTVGGVSLGSWIADLASGAPGWDAVAPPQ